MSRAEPADGAGAIFGIIAGHWISRALWVVTDLGVADVIGDQGVDPAAIAAATGAVPARLERVLQALCTVGIFERRHDGRFFNNGSSDLLRSDHPQSARDFVLGMLDGEIYESFDAIEAALISETSAFSARHGAPPFEYYATRPAAALRFAQAMSANTRPIDEAVAAHEFAPFRHVVDVGGSNGTLMRKIVARHPAARGTLFDLPHVTATAEAAWRNDPDATRLEAVGGSFFDAVEVCGDLYLLKHVLHDWSDDECRTILGNLRRAMTAGASLAIIEMVLPNDASPHPGWAADLAMLALTDRGRERTEDEFNALLTTADFEVARVTPVTPHISIIEARPIA